MAEILSNTQLATKLTSLRKATEDYETAKDLLKESEKLIRSIRSELRPYMNLFENTFEPQTRTKRKSPAGYHRVGKIDTEGVAKWVANAGGHCSAAQFARSNGLTNQGANGRLHATVKAGLIVATKIGRRLTFHTIGKEPKGAI